MSIASVHRALRARLPFGHTLIHLMWTLPSALRGLFMLATRPLEKPLRVVIGATGQGQEGWIPTELYTLNLLKEHHWKRFFKPGTIDAILAEHVWEHLTTQQAGVAARICYHYLKPGGRLRIAVPDGCHPSTAYRNFVKPGGSGPGADDHKQLYTHKIITDLFTREGYDIILREYFDENGTFHRTNWNIADGNIRRSSRQDKRNQSGELVYTSIILDAIKPGG